MKDIDWKICLPVGLGLLAAGTALGVFVVKPAMDKAKAKKSAEKKDAKTTTKK